MLTPDILSEYLSPYGLRVIATTPTWFAAGDGALRVCLDYGDCGKMWDFSDDPATKQPDRLTERERGAWELYCADPTLNRRQKMDEWTELHKQTQIVHLAMYDRAEKLFKAKADEQCRITQELCNERVKRVEQERDSLRSQLIDAVDEARRARCKIVEHYAEVERLTKERDELAAWKAGALDVLNLWDAVAVEAFGWNAQTLCGQSKAAETIKVIRGLREEVKELARKLEGAKAEVERLAAYARETYEFCASAATLESAKAEGRRELADDALEWLRHEAGK
jgi:hypothetical protein